nr:PorV/PorQ family protein [Elusimicrobiota bacterium]
MTYIRKPLFFIVLIFYYSAIVSAETSGADFLKIGPGSRAQGMGGAFVAVSDDATAVYYNPGGLGFIKRQEINLSRLKYLQKTSFSRLFYTRPFEKAATAGLSLYYLNSSGIPAYDNKGKSLADINTGAFAVTLGIGARLFKDIAAAGINLKFIRETLAGRGASAIAADGGILIKKDIISATGVLKNIDAWRAAAAVKNMGTKMKYFSSKESLPLIVSVGGAVELLSRDVILSLQTDFLPAGAGAVIFGAEYTFLDTVSVRAGWREKPFSAADADRGIRAGLGIKNDNMAVDYAYSPYNDIGNTHRVSLSLKFGKEYRKKRVLDNIKKHIEKGKELYHKGDFAGAAGKFRGVIEVDPAHGEAQRWLEKVKRDMSLIQHAEEIKRYLDSGEKYFNELDIVNAQNEFLTVLDFDSSNKKALEFLRKIDLIIMWVADPEASREENRKMKLIKEKAFKERDEENPDKKEAAEDLRFYFS